MNITDTWLQIGVYIDDGSYKTRYSVGDTKDLDILIDGERKTIQMQIAAFDEDILFDEPSKAPITWISKDAITRYRMNNTDTNQGGWMLSGMRKFCAEVLYNGILDENAKNLIKAVRKASHHYETKYAHTTKDYCWIPSEREIFGNTGVEKSGAQYIKLFNTSDARRKKDIFGAPAWWWLRSSTLVCNANFLYIAPGSNGYEDRASLSGGVVLGFCT